jgi:hypothetical protein
MIWWDVEVSCVITPRSYTRTYRGKIIKSIKVVGDDTGHFHIPPYHTLELIEAKL